MKRPTFLPNLITAFGLSCGLFAIFKMVMIDTGHVTQQVLLVTTGFLVLAAFADLLDGAVARVLKAETEFGGMFDALADAISFGVGPAVVVLKSLSVPAGSDLSYIVTTAAMVYSLCGVLRLVRFSVMAHRAKEDSALAEANKKHFTGLPIPAAAAGAISMNLFLMSPEFQSIMSIGELTREWILVIMMLVLGYLMVSRWKFFSIKSLHIRIGNFRKVFITVMVAVLIFFTIISHFPAIFFIAAWSYIIIAWILSMARAIAGKRLKRLEEFEPEPEPDDDIE